MRKSFENIKIYLRNGIHLKFNHPLLFFGVNGLYLVYLTFFYFCQFHITIISLLLILRLDLIKLLSEALAQVEAESGPLVAGVLTCDGARQTQATSERITEEELK